MKTDVLDRRRKPRIAILRGGEWDCTQAIPRMLDALKGMGLKATILCWDKSGKKQAREVVDGTEVIRFRRYIPPRNVLLFVWWPVWWGWLLWRLIRGRYDLVHTMDIDTLVPSALGSVYVVLPASAAGASPT